MSANEDRLQGQEDCNTKIVTMVHELPPLDISVTTADPVLEPPIVTVSTVLSLIAVDYPTNKLACYVSDDGCSPLTFYALVEASKFAKLRIPFCKKYNVQDIFAVGSETLSTTVEWAMSEMLKNLRVMKEAQAEVRHVFDRKGKVDETCINELKFLKAVIKETLRLHPLLHLF
ncbi:hypothetical protein Q3G72_002723 [Acer saccharum]|nr:hypothetical protein Q3G72_002723 [Acer saccharum]